MKPLDILRGGETLQTTERLLTLRKQATQWLQEVLQISQAHWTPFSLSTHIETVRSAKGCFQARCLEAAQTNRGTRRGHSATCRVAGACAVGVSQLSELPPMLGRALGTHHRFSIWLSRPAISTGCSKDREGGLVVKSTGCTYGGPGFRS